MSWLWWGAAAWIAMDIAAGAWWARHRSREKRAEARDEVIREQLREIGRLRAVEASAERDLTLAKATRRRLVDAAALRTTIPHQIRRTEEDR